MDKAEWTGFASRFRDIARMGTEEYGLTVSMHPHAAGFMDFEPEVERLLAEIDPELLKLCLDTGHSHYAGFDPVRLHGAPWRRSPMSISRTSTPP